VKTGSGHRRDGGQRGTTPQTGHAIECPGVSAVARGPVPPVFRRGRQPPPGRQRRCRGEGQASAKYPRQRRTATTNIGFAVAAGTTEWGAEAKDVSRRVPPMPLAPRSARPRRTPRSPLAFRPAVSAAHAPKPPPSVTRPPKPANGTRPARAHGKPLEPGRPASREAARAAGFTVRRAGRARVFARRRVVLHVFARRRPVSVSGPGPMPGPSAVLPLQGVRRRRATGVVDNGPGRGTAEPG